MKRHTKTTAAIFLLLFTFITYATTVVHYQPGTTNQATYSPPINVNAGLIALQDSVSSTLISSWPSANTVTTFSGGQFTRTGITGYVFSVTNVTYQNVLYSEDTATWPKFFDTGIGIKFIIITNPPVLKYGLGTTTNTIPISNMWINTGPNFKLIN